MMHLFFDYRNTLKQALLVVLVVFVELLKLCRLEYAEAND